MAKRWKGREGEGGEKELGRRSTEVAVPHALLRHSGEKLDTAVGTLRRLNAAKGGSVCPSGETSVRFDSRRYSFLFGRKVFAEQRGRGLGEKSEAEGRWINEGSMEISGAESSELRPEQLRMALR